MKEGNEKGKGLKKKVAAVRMRGREFKGRRNSEEEGKRIKGEGKKKRRRED